MHELPSPDYIRHLVEAGRIVVSEAKPMTKAAYKRTQYRNPHYHRDYQRKRRLRNRLLGLTADGLTPRKPEWLRPVEKLVGCKG